VLWLGHYEIAAVRRHYVLTARALLDHDKRAEREPDGSFLLLLHLLKLAGQFVKLFYDFLVVSLDILAG
jgi:hypothetical protein